MRPKLRLFFFSCFSLLFSLNSYAFKFSPMSTTLTGAASTKSTLFFLENDSNQAIAVQVNLAKREMDINGVESNPQIISSDELTLYPTQLIIPPNEKRSVKVTWTGNKPPMKELSFRLIAEQLPIELDKNKNKKSSIKVLLRYVAALYLKPEDYVSDVKILETKDLDKRFLIQVENIGKKHQVLSNLKLSFSDEKTKKEIILFAEDLKGMSGENILAESKRIFVFPKTGKFLELKMTDKVKITFDKD